MQQLIPRAAIGYQYPVFHRGGGTVAYSRYVPLQRGLSGLGATTASQQAVLSSTSITGSTMTALIGSNVIWASAPVWAIPVIGAAVAGVTIALMLIWGRKGPKQKVATTEIVNKVEPVLQENLRAYLGGPRTVTSQAQAIENYKAGWQWVVERCGIPEMGDPGQKCISDRSPGGQWPWASYYLDPIVDDPQVKDDPMIDTVTGLLTEFKTDPVTGEVTAVPFGETGNQYMWLVLAAAAVGVALILGGGK